uniref:Uncharacterized protein n=1 Tax=Clastoptera arizonana TaxID=38151 RepID=A0A1B6CK69_9HEMI
MVLSSLVIHCLFASILVQGRSQDLEKQESPLPYEYQYKVEDPPTQTYFGKQETGDAIGKIEGSYYVWLPDSRLMKVTYYVDNDSGFVPKIEFQENSNPFGKK